MHDALFRQLTASQREAVFHTEGPLLVLAGPGSGKTRVITHRIAALIESGVRPHNICAITFTNKAAEQMRSRTISLVGSCGVHISTFHSLCVRILRSYASSTAVNPAFSIYDETDQLGCIRQALKDCDVDSAGFPPARTLDAISRLKNNLIAPDRFRLQADDFFTKQLAKVYDCYQRILSGRNALDFDDLLMKTACLLKDCPDVCRQLSDRFRFLLVDEYQDTNYAQYSLAKLLVSAHGNICVTGDPDQSIYRWRGADIGNILAFEKDWPGAVVVRLEENFRSGSDILEIADKLIANNLKRKPKKLVATRPPCGNIFKEVFDDEQQEAETIASKVKQLVEQGISAGDIAVFYRVNSASRTLEETFIRNKIAYQLVRGVEFYRRKEIRDLLAYLRLIANPDDALALLRIINSPARGIGKTTIEKIRTYAASRGLGLFEALKQTARIDTVSSGPMAAITAFVGLIKRLVLDSGKDGIASFIERVFSESSLASTLDSSSKPDQNAVENVHELINSAAQYEKESPEPSLPDYLQQISLFTDADSYDDSVCRVALMTLHAAKGLEFERVFIIGLEDGLLPHESSRDDDDEIEEERRLFFVGITRAKSGLYLSCCRYRTKRGQLTRSAPSEFLYELGMDFGPPQPGGQNGENCYDFTNIGSGQPDGSGRFVKGQRVNHRLFGCGSVKEFVDMGDNSVVIVRFDMGQTKTLMVKYAGLS